jgi:hypothetical protein
MTPGIFGFEIWVGCFLDSSKFKMKNVCMVMSLIGGSLELKKNIIYWRVEIIL